MNIVIKNINQIYHRKLIHSFYHIKKYSMAKSKNINNQISSK